MKCGWDQDQVTELQRVVRHAGCVLACQYIGLHRVLLAGCVLACQYID
jgi:hypothetical protein